MIPQFHDRPKRSVGQRYIGERQGVSPMALTLPSFLERKPQDTNPQRQQVSPHAWKELFARAAGLYF